MFMFDSLFLILILLPHHCHHHLHRTPPRFNNRRSDLPWQELFLASNHTYLFNYLYPSVSPRSLPSPHDVVVQLGLRVITLVFLFLCFLPYNGSAHCTPTPFSLFNVLHARYFDFKDSMLFILPPFSSIITIAIMQHIFRSRFLINRF
jgi:hypothetical protein